MPTNKQTDKSPGNSTTEKFPEIIPPLYQEDQVIPEVDPEIIVDEDPFENPPPYEIPEPGEGP